jgi:hypothetical protein
MKAAVVVPWHNPAQCAKFAKAWNVIYTPPDWLIYQQDADKSGCGATKNKGIRRAMDLGYEIVVILDDDVFPSDECKTLEQLIEIHTEALKPQEFPLLEILTNPPARGNPYFNKTSIIPVAASVGWWKGMPDRDAARQLVEGVTAPMEFTKKIVYGRPVMLCGMHIGFRPAEWWPWCSFLPVSRMDDVFMSWLWCKEAARRHHCFNFKLPALLHSRQSHVFNSLIDEAKWLEFNDQIWEEIWFHPSNDYGTLRRLIPV